MLGLDCVKACAGRMKIGLLPQSPLLYASA